MLKEHAKVMYLLQEAGEIIGRKKLQKIVYISKKFNFDFNEKFNFHMYGPYSDELSLQVEELAELGFIEEEKEQKSGYSQYKYELSAKGEEYLQLYPPQMKAYDRFVDKLKGESSRFLELVSTMLYFDHLPRDERVEKIHKVKKKQNYTVQEIEEGFQFIEQLQKQCGS